MILVVCIGLSGEKERERDHSGPRWSLAPGARAGISGLSPGRTGVPAQPEAPTTGVFGKRGEPQKYSNFFDLRILLVILSGTIEDFGLHHVLQCPNDWFCGTTRGERHGFHQQTCARTK